MYHTYSLAHVFGGLIITEFSQDLAFVLVSTHIGFNVCSCTQTKGTIKIIIKNKENVITCIYAIKGNGCISAVAGS